MTQKTIYIGLALLCLFLAPLSQCWSQQSDEAPEAQEDQESLRALIIEGQNNHGNWPETSLMMKVYLEQTELFAVDIIRTAAKGTDPDFAPNFADYDVVVSNYNGAPWPEETQSAFIEYMKGGGGFVVVHAADNAFGNWTEYNEMIGVGGWGGRNEKSGPLVYLSEAGEVVRDESAGNGGHHGRQHPFSIVTRDDKHPITKGMPREWMHVQDELYDKLRGPAVNMKILATAFATPETGGSGRHEPMIMTIEYGEGRIFHTPMGHGNNSQECVGFITVLQRGAEWAATGEVTVPIPEDFPGPDEAVQRSFIYVAASELGATRNVHRIGNLFLAGQPTKADIEVIKAEGIRHVITLRTDGEIDWDEKAAVEEAGMKFSTVKFRAPGELTDEVFAEVRELLRNSKDEKVLLHCGSANRVGAVWAAYRTLDQSIDAETAIGEAKVVGMKTPAYEEKANAYIEQQLLEKLNRKK